MRKKSHQFYLLFIVLLFLITNSCLAQNGYFQKETPYRLSYKKDIIFSGVAAGTFFSGLAIINNKPKPNFTIGQFTQRDIDKINFIDRSSAGVWDIKAKKRGSYFKHTAKIGIPISLMAFPGNIKSRISLALMFYEGYYMSSGLMIISKALTHRFRPFTYLTKEQVNALEGKAKEKFDEDIVSSSINGSFYSGDATLTAYSFIFFAKVFNDYFPDSKLKHPVWAISIASVSLHGYFRVKSGKHFPTDVIVGSIVGGAIGYLVPYLHKKRMTCGTKLSLNYLGDNVSIVYTF